ncbi:MAG: bifunctional (p)ppGpp synthetase/guanosine-3',5'-bis(diphosphate) 3'-pyrophosphohydrolase, partial [Ruminococcaceae bacterium]|nr:bifunctional (p)ppGpp synthetase/guanosine-3',5'-bis(diphosphate) 3'-pyrophosphohydrolase [Oscillospiraceae bacterium]
MPEGKTTKPEDSYSAKTHLHQPVAVPEMATVAATALPANAPEGALPSEVRPEIVTYDKLVEAIKASGKAYNMEMIDKAYNMANDAHKGVCRRSGEPYICHPLAVARLVLDLGMDTESIAAALLHDVVEDTPTTVEQIKAAFGEEVALLVDGVTKLTKIQFSNIEELQAENLRKMLLAMSRDVRVMIIKLCDRLHNMRTGDAWPEQKRRDKARETMEVYAPIANRLGILNVKEELEDRSLHYLDPIGYEEINKVLRERAGEEFLAGVSGVIEKRLEESGIEGATIKRRVKSIYGIYRKTIMQNKSFDEIYDIYAVRIILDTLAECYSALGLIHDMYHPLPNRFKDYISTPKPNGYQSLHTTVI